MRQANRTVTTLTAVSALAATVALGVPATMRAAGDNRPSARPYAVWMTDQNSTAGYTAASPRGTHGGHLVIYQSEDLEAPGGPANTPTLIDLAQRYALGPDNPTGANVVRPHMLSLSPDGRNMVLAFVGSGHVAVLDAETTAPKALFRMSAGAGGARQAHAAFWTQDGAAVIVANQNGKLLERIDYDRATDTFAHNTAATLNLVTCVTPSGQPCQTNTPVNDGDPGFLGPHNRPDNAPICPVTTEKGHAVVTLRGGGMFVVDPRVTPMQIVAAYGNAVVGRDGCGGRQYRKDLFMNGGTGTAIANPHEFSLYHMRDKFPDAPATLQDNDVTNGPNVFFRAGHHGDARDAHGMVVVPEGKGFIWQFDRLANLVEVFDSTSLLRVATVTLLGGPSSDPTPDIVELSPDGRTIFAALRGPKPQTGAHASAGTTPGLGIVRVDKGGVSGTLTDVLRTSIVNPIDGSEESDPHGITVVPRPR